ncbi:MAG: ISAzo13 family transposase [Chloroflexi bacterium]|nr:ISAzo13 family transposase [Chloroflexota bacterium]
MTNDSLSQKYEQMRRVLNEKQWRQYLALEAKSNGNILQTALAAGVSRNTVKRGIAEMEAADGYTPGARVRSKGGGGKYLRETDPTLVADLEALTEPKGDPMSAVRWTTKSLAHLVAALAAGGHTIKKSALAELLASLRYSLKANKKNIEGVSHIDRDAQFQHINSTCKEFQGQGNPSISVDCKKKELIGNFRNNGQEWQPKGRNTTVNVYDFRSLADGRAVPYGVYDLLCNSGFVNVGIDHDTASFAVESIRRWWQAVGKKLYAGKTALLITSDGGGSNGVRNRLWKKELQQLVNETGLAITVRHLPPATSKWNKIEHRLFSFISINWRAKPLTSLETIIELLNHTTTNEGLTVTAVVDHHSYPLGVKVTDEEMAQLNIQRDAFHPEWNYTIFPQTTSV